MGIFKIFLINILCSIWKMDIKVIVEYFLSISSIKHKCPLFLTLRIGLVYLSHRLTDLYQINPNRVGVLIAVYK